MKQNSLIPHMDRIKKKKVSSLYDEALWLCPDSPLFDYDIEAFGVGDIDYLTAEQLYVEFLEADEILETSEYYSEETILSLMEEQMGKRYTAFRNVYDKRYRPRPKISVDEYLRRFKEHMSNTLRMNGIKRYSKGITSEEKKKIDKSMKETILYLRAIEEHRLAHELWKHYTNDIVLPKTQRSFIAEKVKTYAPRMSSKCRIVQEEAEKLLRKTLENIFS